MQNFHKNAAKNKNKWTFPKDSTQTKKDGEIQSLTNSGNQELFKIQASMSMNMKESKQKKGILLAFVGLVGLAVLLICFVFIYPLLVQAKEQNGKQIIVQASVEDGQQMRMIVNGKDSYQNIKFGFSDRNAINLSAVRDKQVPDYVKQALKSINESQIQVGSDLSLSIESYIDFKQLQEQLSGQMSHQLLKFRFQPGLQKKQQIIQMTRSQKQLKQYLKQISNEQVTNGQTNKRNIQYNLAIKLARQPSNKQALEAEYYYSDRKHRIAQVSRQKQLPMCIFSTGKNVFSQAGYLDYINSLVNLNYSNFRVVYVDDHSRDNSSLKLYDYLNHSQINVRNKILIIRNLLNIGPLPSLYFYIRTYCQKNSIVLILDAKDALIGRQSLKILSSIYSNNQNWFVYSDYFIMDPNSKYILKGQQSVYLPYKTQNYRVSFDWKTSHLQSFRKQLFQAVPIQSLIEYKIDANWMGHPAFYESAYNLFLTFSMMELAGNNRIKHIEDILYNYYSFPQSGSNCKRNKQIYNDYKSRIKRPYMRLTQLGAKPQKMFNYDLTKVDFNRIQKGYNVLIQCLQKYEVFEMNNDD